MKSYSWVLYFVTVFLAFYIILILFDSLFDSSYFLINILFFIVFTKIIYNFRKHQSQYKNFKPYDYKFRQTIDKLTEKGFYKTARDIKYILKLAPLVFKLNKEFVYIINTPLKQHIQTLTSISQMIDDKKHVNRTLSKNSIKYTLSHIEQIFNKLTFSIIYRNSHFKGIHIKNIFRIGTGKIFEGIEILNGVILIGRNEYFDGLILGEFKFGKFLKNNTPINKYNGYINSYASERRNSNRKRL